MQAINYGEKTQHGLAGRSKSDASQICAVVVWHLLGSRVGQLRAGNVTWMRARLESRDAREDKKLGLEQDR